ncbi:hypothetical protein HKX54_11035 [Sulfitobacter sp. M57]|uniref:hypothetical protein n=1 Tax=unclassified Sulfitobacter TaxID=196795 RepID=UPI0023E10D12|nr:MULTISPECIES: hypothetical protein [unclassified Sulfitobacter]MDF3414990.1 hypothetical protein [Sulfitobacter sp. KE5]MDF3422471.1 hypothetical protein [Sulfitobacter sp. KE43]MDF3433536.1 hypothetical protein [Sulfitobacter sp. KE42]MDF3459176.1 hypothetical protein [Sulfitobacter sp. S74]MDF3463075.1 hypothetical protein [Sulfitobacter sp. Ks18]
MMNLNPMNTQGVARTISKPPAQSFTADQPVLSRNDVLQDALSGNFAQAGALEPLFDWLEARV